MVDELGFQQIVNIDYSESIIQDMNKRNRHEQLSYLVVDIFNLDQNKEQLNGINNQNINDKIDSDGQMVVDDGFQYLLDKGTLDAIYPEDNEQNSKKIAKMYDQLVPKVKQNGEIIIISLL